MLFKPDQYRVSEVWGDQYTIDGLPDKPVGGAMVATHLHLFRFRIVMMKNSPLLK